MLSKAKEDSQHSLSDDLLSHKNYFNCRMADNGTLPAVKDPVEDRFYYYFIISSVGSWGLCFVLILIPRIIVYLCNRPKRASTGKSTRAADQVLVEPSFYSSIQNWAEDLISGNTTTGRILVVFAFICSVISFVIYIISKSSNAIVIAAIFRYIKKGKNITFHLVNWLFSSSRF